MNAPRPFAGCADCLRIRDPHRHASRPDPTQAARHFLQQTCPKLRKKGCPITSGGPKVRRGAALPPDSQFIDEQGQ